MIVIRVELWPMGNEKSKREIANAVIANDGDGTKTIGNYTAIFQTSPGRTIESTVKGFKRSQTVWKLIMKALNNAFKEPTYA